MVFSSEGEAPEMFGDPHRIEIVLTNLVGNAMKFTPRGGRIEVTVIHNVAGTSVEVTDTGPGISREEQQRIFERFHRVSTGLVHDVKGSGLGLTLVKHIAEAHGGRVTVKSEPEKGSTFTIHLPVNGPRDGNP